MKTRNSTQKEEGFITGSLLVLIVIVSALLLTITSSAIGNFQSSTKENTRINAQFAADSGLDQAIQEINLDDTWTGTGAQVTLMNDAANNIRTTYEVVVTDVGTDQKNVRSIGRTFKPASSATPAATRIFELELRAVTSGTSGAGVVSGVGGLYMDNNSKITGGDVIVGGILQMSNQSQIGLSSTPTSNAVNLRIAHHYCPVPADATFPRLCASGENGQPISMQNNAKIYADVKANNQTTTTNITNPGLTANSGVAPVVVPIYDRTAHPVGSTYSSTDAAVACPNNNGNVTWPANVKIIGDLDMKNNCTVTITGNVWITGKIQTGNQGKLVVAEGLGMTRPVIMVDSQNGFILQNNGKVLPNSFGTGIEVRTFWSRASCSPDCADVTGADLKNSQNDVTVDLGNNGEANNSVFIAQWTRVKVSNNGVLGAISGQSIELSNQAVINFTASVPGSDNLTKTWVKRGYLRVFQ